MFVLAISLYSCTNESDTIEGTGQPAISLQNEQDDSIRCANTLNALQKYNDSLLMKKPALTRSPSMRKVLAIAAFDAVGAMQGADYGLKFGASLSFFSGGASLPFFVAVCGGIYSFAQSYVAAKALGCTLIANYNDNNANDFIKVSDMAYKVNTVSDNDYNNYLLNYRFSSIYNKIDLPSRFNKLRRVGEDHNGLIRSFIKVQKANNALVALSPIDLNEAIPPIKESESTIAKIINSEAFKMDYNDMFNTLRMYINTEADVQDYIRQIDLYYDSTRQIMDLYAEVFTGTVTTEDDAINLANDYIKIIENYNEYNDEEREIAYSGFMVSAYSQQLWSETLGTGDN